MKYTPELVEQLIKYIETGNYIETACDAVGISKQTFYRWLEEKNDFSDAIKKAESKAIIRNVLIVQSAAKKNWTAAAWFLERKDYKNWGRKEQVGGIPDQPIKAIFEIINAKDKGN